VQGRASAGQFVFEQRATEPVPSVLYEEHIKRTGKSHMAAFAGYLMPLWYSSVAEEHRAVRERAGLFDCTHMGVLEVSGPDAAVFLEVVSTNRAHNLKIGRAQYGYILDAAGNVLDDIIIYRRGEQDFMVVVNAANEPKIKCYLGELKAGRVIVDTGKSFRVEGLPVSKISSWAMKLPRLKASVSDMRDPNRPQDRRVDLALQGPATIDILAKLTDAPALARIAELKGFAFVEECVGGVDCLICRTGYTGSNIGFELFVDPAQAACLWNLILDVGVPLGVVPCGLGARDSLRIEAGLPLYGHELDGKFNISPFEAGYGWAVKLDKEFFIGQDVMREVAETYDMEVARVELPGTRGVRPIRPDDAVLGEQGECVGWVLSAAKVEERQYALAYIDRNATREGAKLGVYYLARSQSQVEQGRKSAVEKGQKVDADLAGTVVSRSAKF
jgi:glycine cleavage system aminomethyltransferase T